MALPDEPPVEPAGAGSRSAEGADARDVTPRRRRRGTPDDAVASEERLDQGPVNPDLVDPELLNQDLLDQDLLEAALTETLETLHAARAGSPQRGELGNALMPLAANLPVPMAPPAEAEPLDDRRLSDVDEWGRSEHLRQLARKVYDPVYRRWFRAEWEGLEKIPAEGGALLVANHAAAIPSDAPVIMHGIETELGRPVFGLADQLFKSLPVVGTLWSRLGGVVAHPDNAYRLLREQGQLVLVFPEGNKGPGKSYKERYRIQRFGRGGFVEIAMRAGVPIVPVAVVGAEESMPILWKSGLLAKLTGLPYAPVTANALLFGPLGAVMYFPAKFKLRVLDPVHIDVPPGQERYSKSKIMDVSENIREQIQSALYEMLRERQSVWFG